MPMGAEIRRRRTRRRRIDCSRHVGLDLRLSERGVVHADVVDETGEVLTVDAVSADLKRATGGCHGGGGGRLATWVPLT